MPSREFPPHKGAFYRYWACRASRTVPCPSRAALRWFTGAGEKGQAGEEGLTEVHVHFPLRCPPGNSRQPQDGGHWQPARRAPAPRPRLLLLRNSGVLHMHLSTGGQNILSSSLSAQPAGNTQLENYPSSHSGMPDMVQSRLQHGTWLHRREQRECYAGTSMRAEARNCTLKEVICFRVIKACCQSPCSSETNSKQVFQESEHDLNSI